MLSVALVAGVEAAGAVLAGTEPPLVEPGTVEPSGTELAGGCWPASTAPSDGRSAAHGGITWSESFGVK